MTIREAWQWTVNELSQQYSGHEVMAIAREVFYRSLDIAQDQRVIRAGEELPGVLHDRLKQMVSELIKGMPVQYVTGVCEFLDYEFIVNKNVLIPRPETEELVVWALKLLEKKASGSEFSVFDIGTGSGCIAISIGIRFPDTLLYACDISEEALSVAGHNAAIHNVDVNFFAKDILNLKNDEITGKMPGMDCIISNPPYVRRSEKSLMKSNVISHEPPMAIFVDDEDPLVFYRAICLSAMGLLKKNGILLLEINEYLGVETRKILEENGFLEVEIRRDIHGRERFLKGVWKMSAD